jgi:hypothetical protein
MKKLVKFFSESICLKVFLLFTLSALFCDIVGQEEWTKYSGNPVLLPGAPGTWDDIGFINASVLLIGSTYHMWYTGIDGYNGRIGHATSPDGINWTKYPNPVLNLGDPGSWDDFMVCIPTVVYDGAIYHMWYCGLDGIPPAGNENIGHATSPDGINWTKDSSNPVLTTGVSGSWDAVKIETGFASKEGSTFHLWYNGSDGTAFRIGHATSPDGTNWTKDLGNPVLNVGSPSSWDSSRVQVSSIVYNPYNATYYMYYCGGEERLWSIGYATSLSLNGPWIKNPNNPNFQPSPSAWDSLYVCFPSIIYDGNTNDYKMWYNGNNTEWAGKIGLATSSDTIRVPLNYPTIQAGINAAKNGNIVLVGEGTYYENINFKGKAITVASLFFVDGDTSHIGNTIINGSQPSHPDSGSVVTFDSGEDTTSIIIGFTLTGGTGSFHGPDAKSGGGIKCHNSGSKILHNIIEDNHVTSNTLATVGGGISGGPRGDNSWIVIEYNNIRNNSLLNTAVDGGAVGGGISLVQNGRVNNNIVENNIAQSTLGTAWGGGISLSSYFQPLVRYCIGNKIRYNKALAPTGTYIDGGVGGGLVISGSPKAEIRLNEIIYNEVEGNAGLGRKSWGAGVLIQNQTFETIFSQNYVAYNKAINNSPCNGAGIAIWNPMLPFTGGPMVLNNIITNNTGGTHGGGVFTGGTVSNSAVLINNTICNNVATNGGAIYVGFNSSNPSHPKVINSILWNNGSSIYVLPTEFILDQNYPNPFNPGTVISYQLTVNSNVMLKVFDVLGNEIATLVDEYKPAGSYECRIYN